MRRTEPGHTETARARRQNGCPKDADASDPIDHTLGTEARLAEPASLLFR
jgi:hypothetical protein